MPSIKTSCLLAATAVAALASAIAVAAPAATSKAATTIALWGDLPYSAVQAAAIPALIDDINAAKVDMVIDDGDLKAGSGACPDSLYDQFVTWFGMFNAPTMFTPGDNDWTDCDRSAGTNSLERLDHERGLFFSTNLSMGQKPIRQIVQTDKFCLNHLGAMVSCVENRRWTVGSVTYITMNVQGSCNNLCDVAPDAAEYAARNAANIKWLQLGFADAKAKNSAAVMIITQADPGFDTSGYQGTPMRDPKTLAETDANPDGYQSFLLAVRTEVINFGKPVAYVHGDSHYFRIDKPLADSNGARVENFTRVETFGDHQENGTNDVNWLKVTVNPKTREVFSYQPQIVPANRVVHPVP